MATPGSDKGGDDLAEDLERCRAHVARGFKQRAINLGEREEDRSDRQHDVELDERHRVAELRIKKKAHGLVDDADRDQKLVDQSVAAEHRQPGDGANEIASPKRHHGQQEQGKLPFEILHLHRQVVGKRIGEDQADRHHRGDGETKRRPQRPDEDRRRQEIRMVRIKKTLGYEKASIVLERKGRRHAVAGRFPEAENED